MSTSKFEWGLQEAGVPGPDSLRNALTSCVDPLKAIEEFQVWKKKYIKINFSV